MKNFKNIFAAMSALFLLILGGNLRAQAPICAGEEFCITLNQVRGDIQWQSTVDQVSWTSINGATNDTLCMVAGSTAWYRAEITEGDCNPIFSDTVYIQVFPGITINAGPDITGCSGQMHTLGGSPTASGGTGTLSYAWSPATGLSSASDPNPMTTLASSISYQLSVSDSNGCSATDSVVITSNPSPTADAGADTTGCPPDTIYLGGSPAAMGGTPPYSYLWSPSTWLSDSTIANPMTTYSNTDYTLTVTDANGCIAMDTVEVSMGGSMGSGTQTFAYTGGVQMLIIPCVNSITIEAWGGEGGMATNNSSCSAIGGDGGYAWGDLNVTPGDTLWIYVGGAGAPGNSPGWNGGGSACTFTTTCSGGGGASDVRLGGQTLNDRIIVAGGGGGAEWSACAGFGGAGGGLTGGTGSATLSSGAYNGTGGTQTAGGVCNAGASGYVGTPGTFGVGGTSGMHPSGHAAGGGGGWWGGAGSGADGHGGGGSSYVGGMSANTGTTAGVRTGNGQIVITW